MEEVESVGGAIAITRPPGNWFLPQMAVVKKPRSTTILILLFFAVATVIAVGYVSYMSEDSTATGSSTSVPTQYSYQEPVPTVLIPPEHPDAFFWVPEYAMERFSYGEDSYPQFEEILPDAPCATWENEGIGWVYWEDGGIWIGRVYSPLWRFCGYPLPFPPKPDGLGYAPKAWLDWTFNRPTTVPTPDRPGNRENSSSSPEPTSLP